MKNISATRALLIALAGALTISACKTLDPYTREEKTSSATKGAVIGAAGGAVIGAISGSDAQERRKRALIGAGVGALAGGAVGVYMDRQEAELRRELEGTGVSVTRKGDDITLNMPGNITFRTGSSDLDSQFFAVLDSVAKVVTKYDKTLVEVAGHTDSVGADDMNMRLSQRRADTVARYLMSRGINEQRLIPIGAGKTLPIASNDTESGRQANRRVELTLLPIKQG
jgi:outer membrane protein OmpA-like peptidoglycan-associated protein